MLKVELHCNLQLAWKQAQRTATKNVCMCKLMSVYYYGGPKE